MIRRLLVRLARIVGGLGLLLLIAAAAGWLWLRTSLPEIDGERTVEGLGSRVTIVRDERGVPYIKAQTSDDAYFALGFVHAQDRLTQMELVRRFGAGRLSELIGSSGLGIDRYMRTLGLYRLAEESFRGLPLGVKDALVAYAAGVNAFLADRDGALPPELALLWHEPEPWKPADSLVWGRLMALRLTGNWYSELLRGRMAQFLPIDRIAALWPVDEERPTTTSSPRDPSDDTSHPSGSGSLNEAIRPNPNDGSNAWAIAGSRTQSGSPILANDPHLGLTLPNIWYLARIDTPDLTLAGATTPGVPFHILGHNSELAWGLTTTHGDASDIFIERLSGEGYKTPDGTEPFAEREETIEVRFGDPVTLRVRSTRHGPVISGVVPGAAGLATEGTVVSLAHTALLAGDLNAEAIYRVNRADSVADLLEALSSFRSPQQNVLFADRHGRIGMQVTGRAPVRRHGKGFMPAPGWTGDFDWTGFLPYPEMPRVIDPETGYVVNANNAPVPPDYPHFLARTWPEPFRAARIEEVLKRDRPASVKTSTSLQLDVRSLGALAIRDLLVDTALATEANRRALGRLRAWNGSMSRDLSEPLIYYAWLREVYSAVFADELGDLYRPWLRDRPDALRMALREQTAWCDNLETPNTESCGPVLGRALQRALVELRTIHGAEMTDWRWGSVHRARFGGTLYRHVPGLRDYFDLVIETDGGNFTVNRGGMDLGDPVRPFQHEHGPGYRAVYDLSDPDRSRMVIAAGQSGNPFSPWYDDLLEPWRNGEYLQLAPWANPPYRLVLVPEEQSP